MPLDPLVKGFLDQLTAAPGPKMWEMSPTDARAAFAVMMQLVGPKDVPIGKIENLVVPGPGGDIPIRVYAPVAGGGDPLPALIYFHGGGFVIGDLETHDGLCRMFANEGGFRVIAVDYRLSPEHKFPAAVDDAYAAVTWIEANAATFGVDPNRIALGGDSAGGALAAVVSQMAKEKAAPKIAFQLLLFPTTQIGTQTRSLREFAEGYFLEGKTIRWFFENYLPADIDKSDPRISPLCAPDLSGLPPAYVMVAGFDPLYDEGIQYAEKLKAAGVAVEVADYPDLVHCFIYLQAVIPQAHEATAAAAMAVRNALAAV
jgi:acetyl esterase/lipase